MDLENKIVKELEKTGSSPTIYSAVLSAIKAGLFLKMRGLN